MSDSGFVHLRVHSDQSLLEGRMTAKDIAKAVAADGMPAVAITNRNNMFNGMEFSKYAAAEGVQPILGCALDVSPKDGGGSVVLLAQDEAGWKSLCAISQRIWMRGYSDNPEIFTEDLKEFSEGLIFLSGGAYGPAGRMIMDGKPQLAEEWTRDMAAAFPDRFYVEIQRHPDVNGILEEAEEATEDDLLRIAYEMELPIVASNDARFLVREDFDSLDAMIAIGDKTTITASNRRRYTPSHALLPASEMREIFSDLPEACDRTVEIATRCAYKVPKLAPILPHFAKDEVGELRKQAREGLAERLKVIPHSVSVKEYEERLEFELDVIEKMGFPGYFLIVADFIAWAKKNNIPVGPGRGSGAGSLVAYSLTITDLDPLRYSLLFERFLNPERVSMPDFDIDFCMDRREEVITYVQQKYGADRVGQIITFGGLLSKASIRDVGRVMGLAFGQTDRLSKLIPLKGVTPVSIEDALKMEPRLVEACRQDDRVAEAVRVASMVEGSGFRNAGTHAAGIVIADRPLHEMVPVYRDPKSSMPATQFNMAWVEDAGLVKFDFLGLKTLTVIQKALDLIEDSGWGKLDISRIPVDDKASFELMASAETVSVFQIESPGMMDALRRMRPTRIEDIIALVALYRPGPMENIPVYCEVKNGLRDITSIHPTIDHILEETQGIIVYQEQVMQIAQVMGGYTLGGADLLRRAMGKKKPEEMAKERPKFIDGCRNTHGVDAEKAGEVFDLLEKFANYGFNKSHAAAYAMLSYQTAYLKAHFPVEFMAAVANCDMDKTEKLAKARGEMIRMGIEISAPDVNRSGVHFQVDQGTVLYPLSALKGVGPDAVSPIIEERKLNGPFTSMENIAGRVDLRRVGKTALEAMAKAGAFSSIIEDRAEAFSICGQVMDMSKDIWKEETTQKAAGDLFADLEHGSKMSVKIRRGPFRKWSHAEMMSQELSAVGFHLSGHPLDDRLVELNQSGVSTIGTILDVVRAGKANVTLAGIVVSYEEKPTKKGGKFGIITLSDPSGVMEILSFGDNVAEVRKVCEAGSLVVLNTRITSDGETIRANVMGAQTVDQMLSTHAPRDAWIYVSEPGGVNQVAETFRVKAPGNSSVFMVTPGEDGHQVILKVLDDVLVGSKMIQEMSRISGVRLKMTEKGEWPPELVLGDAKKGETEEDMEPA